MQSNLFRSKTTRALCECAVMLALACAVNVLNVPNPNMILIAGLVVCGSLFGYPGGICASVVMMGYTLFFFSTGNDFVTFSEQNLQKVAVSAVGITVVAFFVSFLRYTVTRTVNELSRINDLLEDDNALLEQASAIDSLTNTRNRFALRRDFPGYVDKDLHVMMIDIDNFKNLNDTYGHHEGDYVLNQMGRTLTQMCVQDHVYRYGGDEFLVICPGIGEADFVAKSKMLKERLSAIEVEGTRDVVFFSAGYVHGTPAFESDLRLMVRQADANLYKSKNAGKDRITGSAFSRSAAAQEEFRKERAATRIDSVQPRPLDAQKA